MSNIHRTTVAALSAAAVIGVGLSVSPSQAAYVVTLTQVADPSQPLGYDVVANGSGAIDLTGLTLLHTGFGIGSGVDPSGAFIVTATAIVPPVALVSAYTGFTGPTSFGGGGYTSPSSGSGDYVGIIGNGDLEGDLNDATWLIVPDGYASGSPLSDTMTFDNTTLWSLGMTPGVYTWTWGAALSGEGDSFTLDVVAVPESSTWAMMLLGFGGLGFAGYNASRKCARVALRLL